jgi:hypothetical protein
MNDREVVEAFVAHLGSNGHAGLKVDRRPDEENRGSPDVDAIAGRFVIEHTSVDTVPNQRRDSDWFMRAVGDLERELEVSQAPHLIDGRHVIQASAGIPFRLHVVKSSRRRPGVFFGRFAPGDNTLSVRIRSSFERKAAKLAKYQAPGVVTVLLVESSDIAMMNDAVMLAGIRCAYSAGPPEGVDQVWFADTSIEGALVFRDFTPELRAPAV